jgi:hypothetical protein
MFCLEGWRLLRELGWRTKRKKLAIFNENVLMFGNNSKRAWFRIRLRESGFAAL